MNQFELRLTDLTRKLEKLTYPQRFSTIFNQCNIFDADFLLNINLKKFLYQEFGSCNKVFYSGRR